MVCSTVHYAPSAVTETTYQGMAANLIIGQHLLPHVLVHATDAREVNIQNLTPSNTRFKCFIFPGEHAQEVAAYLNRPECFHKYQDTFNVITVLQGSKDTVNYLPVPRCCGGTGARFYSMTRMLLAPMVIRSTNGMVSAALLVRSLSCTWTCMLAPLPTG
ncbi:hypothetical protein BJV78DRAFT_410935 [Lactifluus subvellereus]|nr:hypothetical protein BJV78DRAFT_410935 [Lactifluus subvellereus]